MAFPTSLINVTDLLIESVARGSYGGDDGVRTVVCKNLSAIVERRSDLIRNPANEEVSLLADLMLDPGVTGIEEGHRATWTDFYGTVTDAEVLVVEPYAIGGTPHHVRVRVGRQ